MIAGLLLADALYAGLLLASSAGALWSGARVYTWASAFSPWPVAVILGAVATFLAYLAIPCGLGLLLPRPKPGKYPLLKSPQFFAWMFLMMVRRALDVPPVSTLLMQFNVLRWLTLRCLGAKIHFTTSMSSDVTLLDPWLFEAGANVVLGSRAFIAGHYVKDGVLFLGKVTLGADVLVGADSTVAPGVSVGQGSQLEYGVTLSPFVQVGAGCRVPQFSHLNRGTRLEDGARVVPAP